MEQFSVGGGCVTRATYKKQVYGVTVLQVIKEAVCTSSDKVCIEAGLKCVQISSLPQADSSLTHSTDLYQGALLGFGSK